MENLLYTNKTFEKEVYINTRINNREFEDCIFRLIL